MDLEYLKGYIGKNVHIGYRDGDDIRGIDGIVKGIDSIFIYLIPPWKTDFALAIKTIEHIKVTNVGEK